MNNQRPSRLAAFCLVFFTAHILYAGEIDKKSVVKPARQKTWQTFSLSQVRLLAGSPFYRAMLVDQRYMLGMDINLMLGRYRRAAGLPAMEKYPGSAQPPGTRPGDLNHYLSAVSLMYAQTGDKRFLERANHLIKNIHECESRIKTRQAAGDSVRGFNPPGYLRILKNRITLGEADEAGYPWGGTMGNDWYGIHKRLAALRDAYLYCDNKTAFDMLKKQGDDIAAFALKVNPDLFDDMLDIEHGGMNEVFADLYALTGDEKYMIISMKFNHQKVILNTALGNDVLYGRHANMQVPTFVGTARQYQLTGNSISQKATENFLRMVYKDHTSCIGGNSRYERFGRPGEITGRLGFTANETCNTYNMLKVALNEFETGGDWKHMNYFERALYNHILASQDPDSGGVTYYTSLMPGFFKSYSRGYDLTGVWCCVGTGMENHAKYGEAVYFHNADDLLVNLFIPTTLNWAKKGLSLRMETRYPEEDRIKLVIEQNKKFTGNLCFRYPAWAKKGVKISINGKPYAFTGVLGEYIRINRPLKKGDKIELLLPQSFHIETAADDPHMASVFYGPLALAGQLGTAGMPATDRVRFALQYKNVKPKQDDIPMLLADSADMNAWVKPVAGKPLTFRTVNAGKIGGKTSEVTLAPFYKTQHQRYTLYFKFYTPEDFAKRQRTVSDEIDVASFADEKAHGLKGERDDTTTRKDGRDFWENNRTGRMAKSGGWFSYRLRTNPSAAKQYLTVTYWGSSPGDRIFDVLADGKVIATEELDNPYPLTYYNKTYLLPADVLKGKPAVAISFRAKAGKTAGCVFALKTSSEPDKTFPNYSFYTP